MRPRVVEKIVDMGERGEMQCSAYCKKFVGKFFRLEDCIICVLFV